MLRQFRFLVLLALSLCLPRNRQARKLNELNGKHLRVLPYEYPNVIIWTRNATNHVISLDGILVHHLKALAMMLNFSHSIVPAVIDFAFQDSPVNKGPISYIANGESDYLLTGLLQTTERMKLLDFPASWYEGPYVCIIPYPTKTFSVAASFKPLSYEVWISIMVSVVVIVLCLNLLLRKKFRMLRELKHRKRLRTSNIDKKNRRRTNDEVAYFVFGNLVSQGQRFYSQNLLVRIVAGAWCIGCFFLIQIYSSNLISHLTSPHQKPIATSIWELAQSPYISVSVDYLYGLKLLFLTAESGKLKLLGDKVRKDPKYLCNLTEHCLETVRRGDAAYCGTMISVNSIVFDDLKNTGTCHYTIMKDTLFSTALSTALTKNSPYTETISIGILRLKEAGLHNLWHSWYIPSPERCQDFNNRQKSLQRLSITHLTSAFSALLCGIGVSTILFMFELLISIGSKLSWHQGV